MKKKEIIINRYDSENQDNEGSSELSRRVHRQTSDRRRRAADLQNAASKTKNKNKKTTIITAVICALVLVALVAWGLWSFLGKTVTDPELDGDILMDDLVDDKVSVLLVGTDAGGYNTDTIMLIMMDCKTHSINMMSIPRDTRVPNPYGGGYSKINAVYGAKGMEGLIEQIGQITGLPINFYVKMDFTGFREIIDILGGVDFDVPMRLKYDDPAQNLHIDLQAGMQHLDGNKAEQLVRARNQYPQADITRTEVQRNFMKELIKQHATASNLFKVRDLYSAMIKYVKTNITVGDAIKYATAITKVEEDDINMYILPGEARTLDSSYWLYDSQEMEKLANDVFWYNVKIKPTPRPTSRPTSVPSSTHSPSASMAPREDNTNTPTPSQTPKASASPTPKATQSPTQTPSSSQTSKPTQSPTPTPSNIQTPQPSIAPGDYPEGL